MDVSIIKPTKNHIEAISAICSAGWKQTVEGKLSEEYQEQNIAFWYNHERIRSDMEAGYYTHVALIDSNVTGVIGGGMTNSGVSEVFMLFVDETYRYKGTGRLLLEALTELQKEQGATEQWVSVQEDNQHGIPFYEARGFQLQGKKTERTDTGEEQVSLRYSRQI
ncbi:GNAT family N-acetyltransferase [Planococcus halotolerans]|uniref:GNAT family N-acetyltransferase n=1 Tax=Planococcus halotolerans TaxID=2233542 RepID=UPI00109195E5|nr:GNAT family N-acetyltransferase [Planococcus halotolerans]QHJ69901.1 GNAT family N-acetyltransferase [Planococcus halotolerans]